MIVVCGRPPKIPTAPHRVKLFAPARMSRPGQYDLANKIHPGGTPNLRVTKFFLAQYLVEVDMTERPHFDDFEVDEYFSSALRLSGRDKKLKIEVFRLGAKPNSREDVVLES